MEQQAFSDPLAVCCTIVGHFKHSTIAYDIKSNLGKLDLPLQHHLKQQEPTYCNTSLYMLDREVTLAAYGADGSIPLQ